MNKLLVEKNRYYNPLFLRIIKVHSQVSSRTILSRKSAAQLKPIQLMFN